MYPDPSSLDLFMVGWQLISIPWVSTWSRPNQSENATLLVVSALGRAHDLNLWDSRFCLRTPLHFKNWGLQRASVYVGYIYWYLYIKILSKYTHSINYQNDDIIHHIALEDCTVSNENRKTNNASISIKIVLTL